MTTPKVPLDRLLDAVDRLDRAASTPWHALNDADRLIGAWSVLPIVMPILREELLRRCAEAGLA